MISWCSLRQLTDLGYFDDFDDIDEFDNFKDFDNFVPKIFSILEVH